MIMTMTYKLGQPDWYKFRWTAKQSRAVSQEQEEENRFKRYYKNFWLVVLSNEAEHPRQRHRPDVPLATKHQKTSRLSPVFSPYVASSGIIFLHLAVW
jgi:hypothetical protein